MGTMALSKAQATPKHLSPQSGEWAPGYRGGADGQGRTEGCQLEIFMEPRRKPPLHKLPLSSWFPQRTFTLSQPQEGVLTPNFQNLAY